MTDLSALADEIERAWRDGFHSARECLSDDEAFRLTDDVEHDVWLDSKTHAALDRLTKTSEDDVERVARAIYAKCPDGGYWRKLTGTSGNPRFDFTREFVADSWEDASEQSRNDCMEFAHAALEAMKGGAA